MGIFNFKIFDELGENIKKMEGENVKNGKNATIKCTGCGASIDASTNKETLVCKYCGIRNSNPNYKPLRDILFGDDEKSDSNLVTKKYYVLVKKCDNLGFSAYDFQTDIKTEICSSVEDALKEMATDIADFIEEGEAEFNFYSQQEILENEEVQKKLEKGLRLKEIEVSFHSIDEDPNW